MWSSRSRKSYQVIDDDYDDSLPDSSATGSVLPIVNPGRNRLFGGRNESQPLMSNTSRDSYVPPPTVHGLPDPSEPPNTAPQMASSSREETYRWDHIANLDQFFSRVYEYHQGGGFKCICCRNVLSLLQFIFIVTFSTFFAECIDYDVMFGNKNTTTSGTPITGKRHFSDVVVQNCASDLHLMTYLCILFATVFWMSRVVKSAHYLLQMFEIQSFYNSALGIMDDDLLNLTWNSVVQRICAVQPKLHLTINSEQLTPADIYNRILRFKNYFVSLVNLRVLPPVFDVPFLGQIAYLPNGLKFNIKRCLFYGSTSPWNGPCLKEEYKSEENMEMLARQMEKHVSWYGLMNLILMPFTFLYQILLSFFLISEMIKKSPDSLGMRRYSNYGRYRVRHFNELNHELDSRLNRSHIYANAYMNQFFSPLLKVVASHIRFIVAAVGFTLTGLAFWDEDVLQIEHVLTVAGGCAVVFLICNSLIPEENLVWQPEVLLTHVTSELHYVPSEWKGHAHTEKVRREFEELFQLKWMFLLHELASPLITPFILLFWMRPRCRDLVRFFNEHTVSVQGLGDVCSFALMDVAKHGDPEWNGVEALPGQSQGTVDTHIRALDGKTEMSALHFATINPDWKAPPASEQFLQRFKARMVHDASALNGPFSTGGILPQRNLLLDSVHSLMPVSRAAPGRNPLIGDGLHQIDGPLDGRDLLASLQGPNLNDSLTNSLRRSGVDLDSAGADLRVQTLYLRGMHDELRQSMAPSRYGASIAPQNVQSLFGVPQLSDLASDESMEASNGRSRLVLRAPQETYDERDEDDDDARPPTMFSGV